jgi:hypothetical protein
VLSSELLGLLSCVEEVLILFQLNLDQTNDEQSQLRLFTHKNGSFSVFCNVRISAMFIIWKSTAT